MLACFIFFVVGVVIGKFIFVGKSSPILSDALTPSDNMQEIRSSGYKFISPLLECEVGNTQNRLNGLAPVREKIEEFVAKEEKGGLLIDAAVYFRDLNNGPWFAVNQGDDFSPASLLKLPVLMAYFKKAETDPSLLTKKVEYKGDVELLSQIVKPEETIEVGKKYSIEELLERMIVYSDNAALTVLEENIEPERIDKITLDLGIETATTTTPMDYMSVRGYAGLFRILYNASYLEKDLSEKALSILSRTQFSNGIVAGVPKAITVSHKFGERQLPDGVMQLHDCGIVYHPRNPYLLCIMTRGTDINVLAKTIAQISSITYTGIENTLVK